MCLQFSVVIDLVEFWVLFLAGNQEQTYRGLSQEIQEEILRNTQITSVEGCCKICFGIACGSWCGPGLSYLCKEKDSIENPTNPMRWKWHTGQDEDRPEKICPLFKFRHPVTGYRMKLRLAVITDSLQESGWASHKRRLQAGLRFNKGRW